MGNDNGASVYDEGFNFLIVVNIGEFQCYGEKHIIIKIRKHHQARILVMKNL